MPLIKSKSNVAFKKNVSEVMKSWKRKGTIGNISPKSKEHARKIALAIAFKVKRGE